MGESTGKRNGSSLLLSSNSLWNIENFRRNLVEWFDREGRAVVVAAPATKEERSAFQLSARLVPIRIRRSGTNPFYDVALLATYYWIMRSEKPVAYLGWTIKPNLYGALAARLAGVPAILNVSGLGTAFLGGRFFRYFVSLLYKIAFQKAPIVFFQNSDDRTLFLERGIVRASQARLLPGSGVNLEQYQLIPPAAGEVTRFLMVARLLGDKGVREYVQAARMASLELPHAEFQLLGPLDEDNRTAISSGELNRWVDDGVIAYLGETKDVRPFLAAASAIVLPSYREGLPRTLLEGAAMGRALIATDVPGCRDVVEHGVNGYLCDARDAVSLSKAMIKFASLGAELRQAMGERSRQMVESRFSDQLVTRAYAMALRELEGHGNVLS